MAKEVGLCRHYVKERWWVASFDGSEELVNGDLGVIKAREGLLRWGSFFLLMEMGILIFCQVEITIIVAENDTPIRL